MPYRFRPVRGERSIAPTLFKSKSSYSRSVMREVVHIALLKELTLFRTVRVL